jgi:hypothetical protein
MEEILDKLKNAMTSSGPEPARSVVAQPITLRRATNVTFYLTRYCERDFAICRSKGSVLSAVVQMAEYHLRLLNHLIEAW